MRCSRPTASSFHKDVYLWIPVLGNILAVIVIPMVGNLSDRIGRRPPVIVGALGSGLLAFGYLYAISIGSVPLAIVMSLLMWGVVYQGYNAVFPSFYPEQFPTRTRVSAMAISQNIGTTITALLPALFADRRPSGLDQHPDDGRRDRLRHHRGRRDRRLVGARDLPGAHARPRRSERRAGAEGRIRPAARRRHRRDPRVAA